MIALAGCRPIDRPPDPDPSPYPQKPLVPATSARAFGDSVGVGLRLTWLDSSYNDFNAIESRLRELGVRYVQDGVCPGCEEQIRRLKHLASIGIRANLMTGFLRGGVTQMQASLDAIRNRLREVAVAILAPNEVDIEPGITDWISATRAYQAELYRRVKSDPALSHLAVIGPSLVHRASRAALGDISAHLDRGNIHPYPGGAMPLHNIADEKYLASFNSKNKPLVATEIGYHSDLTSTSPHRPVSEKGIASYTARIPLEAYIGGIDRTFFLTLMDPWSPAEAQRRGFSGMENSFGLLRWDTSRKPSFIALRNLLRTVAANSAAVGSPGGLRYSLDGAGSDVRQLLLRSADGSYALVIWRQVSVWDREALRDLSPAPDRIDVALGEPVFLARRFNPVDSDAERQRWIYPRRIPVDVAGDPVVVRLTPGSTAIAAGSSSASVKAGATVAGQAPLKVSGKGVVGAGAKAPPPTRRRQRLRRTAVIRVRCAAPCATVSAKGKLVVTRAGRKRVYRLKAVKVKAARRLTTLRLGMSSKVRRSARRALKRGARVRAMITLTARSRSGKELATTKKSVYFRAGSL